MQANNLYYKDIHHAVAKSGRHLQQNLRPESKGLVDYSIHAISQGSSAWNCRSLDTSFSSVMLRYKEFFVPKKGYLRKLIGQPLFGCNVYLSNSLKRKPTRKSRMHVKGRLCCFGAPNDKSWPHEGQSRNEDVPG